MPPNNLFVQLMGGLGNQLFQIAAAYGHCVTHGKTLSIGNVPTSDRPHYYDTWLWKLKPYRSSQVYIDETPSSNERVFREIGLRYQTIPSDTTQLYGYFQSSKYFKPFIQSVRNMFSLPTFIQDEIMTKHHRILRNVNRSVLLHIRRGDYLQHPQLHGILDTEYYKSAIERMKQMMNSDMQLVVLSDDNDWCRSQPWLSEAVIVDEPNDVHSLWIMSQFENYIMSNSSFSWWAVMLGRPYRRVIAPASWYGVKGPQDYNDIYEDDWVLHQVPGISSIIPSKPQQETTVVTAYYPLEGRKSKHSKNKYYEWMERMCRMRLPMVLFTPQDHVEWFRARTDPNMTHIVSREFDALPMWNTTMQNVWQQTYLIDPEMSIHSPELYALWAMKPLFVNDAANMNKFNSRYFVWMDAGCFRSDSMFHYMSRPFSQVQQACVPGRISMLEVYPQTNDTISRIAYGDSTVRPNFLGGGVICGDQEAWKDFESTFVKTLISMHEDKEFVGKDQNIFNRMLVQKLTKKPMRAIHAQSAHDLDRWFSFLAILSGSVPLQIDSRFE